MFEQDLITILKYGVVDLAGVESFGMHPKATDRAEVNGWSSFEGYELGLALDSSVRYGHLGIFQVQKLCDTIHLSPFIRFHCRNIIRIETNKDKKEAETVIVPSPLCR